MISRQLTTNTCAFIKLCMLSCCSHMWAASWENLQFCRTKAQITYAVTAQLNRAFFVTEINGIYDGVEAETRKSQASFQIFKSHPRLYRGWDLNNLKMSLRFLCLGINTIIAVYFSPIFSTDWFLLSIRSYCYGSHLVCTWIQ